LAQVKCDDDAHVARFPAMGQRKNARRRHPLTRYGVNGTAASERFGYSARLFHLASGTGQRIEI
jgi:hypothetical protein